jgi:uncharacterized protein YjdB
MRPILQITVTIIVLPLSLLACGTKVGSVTLDKQTITLAVGQAETLMAIIQPENASNQAVTWEIDNEECASISQDGSITAKSLGSATITVTTKDQSKTATCALTTIPNISLDARTAIVNVGEARTLVASTHHPSALEKGLEWSSSAPAVAKINASGMITALAQGSATIMATCLDGGMVATCKLTVALPVKSVAMKSSSMTLEKGNSRTFIATIRPVDATNQGLKWTSSDTSVATVDSDGEVSARGRGMTTITVTSDDGGKSATCNLTVVLSDAEWIELVVQKCGRAAATLLRSRNAIGGLRHEYGGYSSINFITGAYATMARIAESYDQTMGRAASLYQDGYYGYYREGFRDYIVNLNQVTASSLRQVSSEYKDMQAYLATGGVPNSLVDAVSIAFSVPAKEIEDNVLPEIRQR